MTNVSWHFPLWFQYNSIRTGGMIRSMNIIFDSNHPREIWYFNVNIKCVFEGKKRTHSATNNAMHFAFTIHLECVFIVFNILIIEVLSVDWRCVMLNAMELVPVHTLCRTTYISGYTGMVTAMATNSAAFRKEKCKRPAGNRLRFAHHSTSSEIAHFEFRNSVELNYCMQLCDMH